MKISITHRSGFVWISLIIRRQDFYVNFRELKFQIEITQKYQKNALINWTLMPKNAWNTTTFGSFYRHICVLHNWRVRSGVFVKTKNKRVSLMSITLSRAKKWSKWEELQLKVEIIEIYISDHILNDKCKH